MTIDTYYYGAGSVSAAELDATTGLPGAFRQIGDVSAMSLKATGDKVQHRENQTGASSLAVSFQKTRDLSLDMTIHQLDADNLSMVLQGAVQTVAAGTASAEALPDALDAGATVRLAHPGVASLVLTDSAGSPATLALDTHYSLDAGFGKVTILDATGFTQPFKAAYSFGATKAVGFLTQGQKYYAIKFEGINLARNNDPVIVDLYRLAPGLLQELALISSGNDVAGAQITSDVLQDSTKSATGPLGQFGAITEVTPA